MKRVLVTGAAGFIGYHFCKKLFKENTYEVYGLDSISDYYDVSLKYDRLKDLGIDTDKIVYNTFVQSSISNFSFIKLKLEDKDNLLSLFADKKFDFVVNLAAQAGVRYSLENPDIYVQTNIVGFLNILEGCRATEVEHLVYASSSSVYGISQKMPFKEDDVTSHPISLYAASKKANELMAHTYSHLFNIPSSGLRFFTVYGPWGRPDMALFLFAKGIIEGKPIQLFNNSNMERDFTYVDDVVYGIYNVMLNTPKATKNIDLTQLIPSESSAPYTLYNIGNNNPISLLKYVNTIEKYLGKKAIIELMPMQMGDVRKTYADTTHLSEVTGYKPDTSIDTGIKNFVAWYVDYYNVKL